MKFEYTEIFQIRELFVPSSNYKKIQNSIEKNRGKLMVRLTQIVDRDLIIALQKRLTDELGMSIVFEETTQWYRKIIEKKGDVPQVNPKFFDMENIGNRGSLKRGDVLQVCTKFFDRDNKGNRGSQKCINSDSEAAYRVAGNLAEKFLTEKLLTEKLLKEKLQPEKLLAENTVRDKVFVEFYICNGKMRNFVIPIVTGGEVLGNVYAGQFLVDITKDTNKDKAIRDMVAFGMAHPLVLEYSQLPKEDILTLAKANDIPSEKINDFTNAFQEAIDTAKPLEEVVQAVYLLHEIAQTISYLGSSYYFNNLFLRLKNITPLSIENTFSSELEDLLINIQKISAIKLPLDYPNIVKKINEEAYKILTSVYKYEINYVSSLLAYYEIDQLVDVALDYNITLCQYELSQAEVIIRKVAGQGFKQDSIKFAKAFDNLQEEFGQYIEVKESETAIFSDKIKQIKDLKNRFQDLKGEVDEFVTKNNITIVITADDIEAIFELLSGNSWSLSKVKDKIVQKRVFSDLPSPLHTIRRDLPLRYDRLYLNFGAISPTLGLAERAKEAWNIITGESGPDSMRTEVLEMDDVENELQKCRKSIADLIKCKPEEVIFTASTTEGIEIALSTINFSSREEINKKDIIVLSNLEHDAVIFCVDSICKKYNVKKKILNVNTPCSIKSIVETLSRISNEGKIRAVILSHVTYCSGEMIEVQEIIKEARKILKQHNNFDPVFIVDGAQAIGNVFINFSDIDCEFYAADGYKWLMGSPGSGILVAKKEWLNINYKKLPSYKSYMISKKFRIKKSSDDYYETSYMNVEPIVALNAVVTKHLEIQDKMNNKLYQRQVELATKFVDEINTKLSSYGINCSPTPLVSGIVCISFRENIKFDIYDTIRKILDKKFNVVCRTIQNPLCLRFCISYLNTDKEIEIAVNRLKNCVEEIPQLQSVANETQQIIVKYLHDTRK